MTIDDMAQDKIERPLDVSYDEDPDLEDISKAVRFITELSHHYELSFDELAMCQHIRFVLHKYEEEKAE